jgi:uncharacterized LabA/DUF88 family protein
LLSFDYDSPPRSAIEFAPFSEATTPADAGVVISAPVEMRTIAYVDGYNLYHGRLKYTPFKWLDLRGLLTTVLKIQDHLSELTAVKLFTANIKARLARLGQQSAIAQHIYHRALAARGVEIVYGRFTLSQERVPRCEEGRALDRDDRVPVWLLEEKQTDVQLALHAYRDAAFDNCEQVILCTNDSDLAPALEFIRTDYPHVKIGLVLPRPPGLQARKSKTLQDLAHWTRDHILDKELATHQLPERVQTGKKPADKPAHW